MKFRQNVSSTVFFQKYGSDSESAVAAEQFRNTPYNQGYGNHYDQHNAKLHEIEVHRIG